MIRSTPVPTEFTIGEPETDPVLIAKIMDSRERYMKNVAWYESHRNEIGEKYRGQYVCVAGEQLFAGHDLGQLLAWVRAERPDDYAGVYVTPFGPRPVG